MTRLVKFDSEASLELGAAIAWYEEQRAGLGEALLDAVDEAVGRLMERPDGGTRIPGVPDELPVLRVFVKRFPYSLVCLAEEELVVVIAIAHNARRPGYWRDRIG